MYARQATQSVSHLIELPGLVSNKGIDLAISATALEHGLTVATRNVSDFEPTGVSVFNSFSPGSARKP
jgi:toxin FitB